MAIKAPEMNNATIIVVAAVVTAVVVILSAVSIRGQAATLSRNNSILSSKREVQQRLESNIQALERLAVEYEELGDDRRLILDALPPAPDFAGLMAMMENLSVLSGVQMNSIAEGEVGDNDAGPARLGFTVSLSGSYDALKAFLRNVEISLRPLVIRSLRVSGESPNLSIEVDMATFYQVPFDTSVKTEPLFADEASQGVFDAATDGQIPGSVPGTLNPSGGDLP